MIPSRVQFEFLMSNFSLRSALKTAMKSGQSYLADTLISMRHLLLTFVASASLLALPASLDAQQPAKRTAKAPKPNSTPRISGCSANRNGTLHMVYRNGNEREQHRWDFALTPGSAKTITTYAGADENPLPSFSGDPLEARIVSTTAQHLAESLYESIQNCNFHVAAAVMLRRKGKTESYIINKHGDA